MLCFYCDTELPETAEVCHICGGKQINYILYEPARDEDLPAAGADAEYPVADEEIPAAAAVDDISTNTEEPDTDKHSEHFAENQPAANSFLNRIPGRIYIAAAAIIFVASAAVVFFCFFPPGNRAGIPASEVTAGMQPEPVFETPAPVARLVTEPVIQPADADIEEPPQETAYNNAVTLKDSGRLVEAFELFNDLDAYKDSPDQAAEVLRLMYNKGVECYRLKNYRAAGAWFEYTNGIEDTGKYNALLSARSEETSENGYQLLGLLGFEDAAEIITGSDFYLNRFLGRIDEWELDRNWCNSYGSFISFSNAGGGAVQFRSDYLPVPDEDPFHRFDIQGGIHYQYARNSKPDEWTPLWEYTVISMDIISLHNLYDNLHYKLYRRDTTHSELLNPYSQTKGTMDQYGAMELAYPLAASHTICSSPYGSRFNDTDFHGGLDINVPAGTPIYSVGDGVVSGVYTQFGPGGGAGYYMSIELDAVDPKTGNKLQVTYMHMMRPTTLKEGESVKKGQQIGYSGNSGFSANARNPDGSRREYSAHLHFQFSNNGTYGAKIPNIMINPAWFYPDVDFKDGTHRRISRQRFLDILYADYYPGYPNRVTG